MSSNYRLTIPAQPALEDLPTPTGMRCYEMWAVDSKLQLRLAMVVGVRALGMQKAQTVSLIPTGTFFLTHKINPGNVIIVSYKSVDRMPDLVVNFLSDRRSNAYVVLLGVGGSIRHALSASTSIAFGKLDQSCDR